MRSEPSHGLKKAKKALVIGITASVLGAASIAAPLAAFAGTSAPTPTAGGSAAPAVGTEKTISDPKPGSYTTQGTYSQNVGGGQWYYGSIVGGTVAQRCFSQYSHTTKYHSATSILADINNKVYANANTTAKSHADAGLAYQCHTYWNTY